MYALVPQIVLSRGAFCARAQAFVQVIYDILQSSASKNKFVQSKTKRTLRPLGAVSLD